MIWLTWRQYRLSGLVVLVPMIAVAVALAVTGPQLVDMWTTWGKDFFSELALDRPKTTLFNLSTALVYAAPAVIGVFWGAPLVAREVEAGTHRLVWTQSVTRTRWLSTKLAVVGAGAVVAGLFALALTWWSGPLDDAIAAGYSDQNLLGSPRVRPEVFGARGIVPLAIALFAVAVGVTVGMLVRRTIAAMAITLVVIVFAQVALPTFVQSHLVSHQVKTVVITEDNLDGISARGGPGGRGGPTGVQRISIGLDNAGSWLLGQETVDSTGKVVTDFPASVDDCFAQGPPAFKDCFTQLADQGFRQRVDYIPANKFWTLQWREGGLLLLVTAGLAGFCFWRVRRDF